MTDSQIQPQLRHSDLCEWMREAERLGELRTVLGCCGRRTSVLRRTPLSRLTTGQQFFLTKCPVVPEDFG